MCGAGMCGAGMWEFLPLKWGGSEGWSCSSSSGGRKGQVKVAHIPAGLCSSLCSLQDPSNQRQIHQDAMEEKGMQRGFLSCCRLKAMVRPQSVDGSSSALLGSIPAASRAWGACRSPASQGSGAAPAYPEQQHHEFPLTTKGVFCLCFLERSSWCLKARENTLSS